MSEKILIRNKYLDKVKPYIGKQLIKVFTGQRRVGKSYVLKQVIQEIQSTDATANVIYINKEDLSFDFIKTAQLLNNYVIGQSKAEQMNYVLIDEIQEITDFEKALRSLALKSNFDIYCTGSNAFMLSGELATYLSGRYIEIPVYSLSYSEFLTFLQLKDDNECLMKFLKYGGLPYLMHLQLSDEMVFDYLKGIYNTVMYRDIILRHEVRNTAFLEQLNLFLADNIGQLFSSKKISDYLKSQKINMATSQIITYLSHLCNAYLIFKVNRMDVVGKKIFEIGEKYYFEDLGLRNTLLGFKQADLGKIMENVVYNHLLYNGFEVFVGKKGSVEIDFVARRKGETMYVQVCYLLLEEATIEREFGNLEKIPDNYPKMVVSMDDFRGNTRKGIEHIYLRDFLTREF